MPVLSAGMSPHINIKIESEMYISGEVDPLPQCLNVARSPLMKLFVSPPPPTPASHLCVILTLPYISRKRF